MKRDRKVVEVTPSIHERLRRVTEASTAAHPEVGPQKIADTAGRLLARALSEEEVALGIGVPEPTRPIEAEVGR